MKQWSLLQEEIKAEGITDQDEIDMREQNRNPVKVLCSGYEGQVVTSSRVVCGKFFQCLFRLSCSYGPLVAFAAM